MSDHGKGRNLEYEMRDLFKAAGYSVVRGAGSKGEMLEEKVDLVCSRETRENEFTVYLTIVGIQCKVRGKKQ